MSTVLFNSVTISYTPIDNVKFRNIFIENGKVMDINLRDKYENEVIEPYLSRHRPMYSTAPFFVNHDIDNHEFSFQCVTCLYPEADYTNWYSIRKNLFSELFLVVMKYFIDYDGDFDTIINYIEAMEIDIDIKQTNINRFTDSIKKVYDGTLAFNILRGKFKINPASMCELKIDYINVDDFLYEYENYNFNPLIYKEFCNELLLVETPVEKYTPHYRNYIVISDVAFTQAAILIKEMTNRDRIRSVVAMQFSNPSTIEILEMLENHTLDGMDGQAVLLSYQTIRDEKEVGCIANALKELMQLYPKVIFMILAPTRSPNTNIREMIHLLYDDLNNIVRLAPCNTCDAKAAKEIMLKHITDRYGKLNYNDRKAITTKIDKYLKESNVEKHSIDTIINMASSIIEAHVNGKRNPAYFSEPFSNTSSSANNKEKAETPLSHKQNMNELVGLTEVKELSKKIIIHYTMMDTYRKKGIRLENMSRHMIFTGNPGTAKTTVARLLFEELNQREVVDDVFVEVGRADLIAEYVGQTAVKVKKAFERAKGGILFIDEAYSLAHDTSKGFGSEAIATIVQEMENHRDDIIVIFAGYKKEMDEFVKSNPGLKSRIAFHLDFPDYSKDELMEILKLMVKRNTLTMTPSAVEYVRKNLDKISITPERGNARLMRNILEAAIMNHSMRISEIKDYEESSKKVLSTLTVDDFKDTIKQDSSSEKKRIGFGV